MPEKITHAPTASLTVPDEPIIPFIEGDGTGVDIWPAAQLVLDAAAAKHGKKIAWKEVLAGQKAFDETGDWLPEDDRRPRSASTSSGSRARSPRRSAAASARSTSRCARSSTSTCACARCAGSPGVPSPVKHPEKVDMVIFRENTEDIYAGPRGRGGHARGEAASSSCCKAEFGLGHPARLRHRHQADLRDRLEAPDPRRRSSTRSSATASRVTMVHKGNIQKFTEGAFRNWGYELVARRVQPTSRSAGTTATASPATRSS